MLLIKLKSKYSSEVIRVFAVSVDRTKTGFNLELSTQTDTDRLEACGFEPEFETLMLTSDEFVSQVQSIQPIG